MRLAEAREQIVGAAGENAGETTVLGKQLAAETFVRALLPQPVQRIFGERQGARDDVLRANIVQHFASVDYAILLAILGRQIPEAYVTAARAAHQ